MQTAHQAIEWRRLRRLAIAERFALAIVEGQCSSGRRRSLPGIVMQQAYEYADAFLDESERREREDGRCD